MVISLFILCKVYMASVERPIAKMMLIMVSMVDVILLGVMLMMSRDPISPIKNMERKYLGR